MITIEDVERFLARFHEKMKVFDIVYRDDRGKNLQTLSELEITPIYRTRIIKQLKANDYSEGPIVDTLNDMGELWVFGKNAKGREIYIKIALGKPGTRTICISFHIAEHKMKYPFKKGGTR